MSDPTPDEIAAADARRQAREAARAQHEFEKLGWSKWRVFSWIAYCDPSLICEIENRRDLSLLRRRYEWRKYRDRFAPYSEFESAALQRAISKRESLRYRRPDETLLRALQDGDLKALDRDGNAVPAEYWLSKEPSDIGEGLVFKRKDVLGVWPSPTTTITGLPAPGEGETAVPPTGEGLPKAPDSRIHRAITAVYDKCEAAGEKIPNIIETLRPVHEKLKAEGYQASGRRIQELSHDPRHKNRRGRTGVRVKKKQRRS
jgi:hypothetical protein